MSMAIRSLLPKEHGAYGQIVFPLVTVSLVAGVTYPSALLATAVVAGFLGHEPALVMTGQRGVRVKQELGRVARMWFAVLATVMVVAGGAAVAMVPAGVRWSLVAPVIPAAFLAAAVVGGREKSWPAELSVALAFSLMSIPLGLAAGATPRVAVAMAVVFAVNFVLATLAVRVVILKVRAGGDGAGVVITRRAVLALAASSVGAIGMACAYRVLPGATLLALVPGIVVAVRLAVRPPPPSGLRAVGWRLMATSLATAAILIVGL